MTMMLLLGMIVTVFLLFGINAWTPSGVVTKIGDRFKGSKVSTNVWVSGAVMFVMNGLLFAIAFLIFFTIPFGMMLGLLICIPLSIFVWLVFSVTWQGTYKDKVKMSFIGNSFFIFFIGWVIWQFMRIEQMYPDEDNFMAWIGTLVAIIGSLGALSVSTFVILNKR
ncbi:hypothetical protein [Fictibacillus barbaricus]|uniref:Uncharacterized protein n=1 Tax=Fictibacillus barbaricus TaxID=182136 RepID=A0ABU1U4A0_9BACL|nr:hypothetical protein [Fictibacillus barbaricus]MDR7074317.1 hypothetical protein [Fictibacillus barbaricus]